MFEHELFRKLGRKTVSLRPVLPKQQDIGSKLNKQEVRDGWKLKAQAAFPENPGWFPVPTWKVTTL